MNERFGIIAEDDTDFETIRTIVQRLRQQPNLGCRKFIGNGCGRLCKETAKWSRALIAVGCTRILVVHDADERTAAEIESKLRAQSLPTETAIHICVPMTEIEAWFWADPALLTAIAGKKVDASRSPASIAKPKESLTRLSRRGGTRATYSTAANPQLAGTLDLDACARACPEFKRFREFVGSR